MVLAITPSGRHHDAMKHPIATTVFWFLGVPLAVSLLILVGVLRGWT